NESRGYIINIVGWIGAAIATAFVALRIFSRKWLTNSAGWDDAIIVAAAILNIVTIALGSVSIHYGNGGHVVYMTKDQVEKTLFYSALLRPTGITAYCLPKLSVVMLIIGLMGPQKRRRDVWALYAVIIVLFITSALSFILLFAQCNPPSHLWQPFLPAECFPDSVLDVVTYIAGSWSALTDLILAAYPVKLLWNLQMKKSRKISIMMIMGLGFFAMIAAIIKTTQLSKNHALDPPWELFWLFITTYIETDLVIIAACAPPLPKLILRLMGKDTDGSTHPNENSTPFSSS
ncbi:hypothetical protein EJ04DRAFT_395717, partial [Polyplosphaeria fusca]